MLMIICITTVLTKIEIWTNQTEISISSDGSHFITTIAIQTFVDYFRKTNILQDSILAQTYFRFVLRVLMVNLIFGKFTHITVF